MTEKIFIIAVLYMIISFGLGVLIGKMIAHGHRGEPTEQELREQIAYQIESLPIDFRKNEQDMPTGRTTFMRMDAYRRAARVARGEVDG